jgi:hypothetical protein
MHRVPSSALIAALRSVLPLATPSPRRRPFKPVR